MDISDCGIAAVVYTRLTDVFFQISDGLLAPSVSSCGDVCALISPNHLPEKIILNPLLLCLLVTAWSS